jgi:hypothetical protein
MPLDQLAAHDEVALGPSLLESAVGSTAHDEVALGPSLLKSAVRSTAHEGYDG